MTPEEIRQEIAVAREALVAGINLRALRALVDLADLAIAALVSNHEYQESLVEVMSGAKKIDENHVVLRRIASQAEHQLVVAVDAPLSMRAELSQIVSALRSVAGAAGDGDPDWQSRAWESIGRDNARRERLLPRAWQRFTRLFRRTRIK